MKKVLVFALVAIFAVALTSCGKNKEKTNTEKLCIEKGWVLSSATAAPYYTMIDGTQITNIYADYLYDFERDDIMVFSTNGSQVIKPGAKKPGDLEDGYIADKASTWNFSNDEKSLTFQIPFFYDYDEIPARTFDEEKETATITSLTETELVLTYTYNIGNAKEACTFTLTYVPVK